MLKQYNQGYKIIIAGNSGVGKSCLLLRFVDNIFTSNTLATIGVDFKFKTLQINGSSVKLQIWDTAGSQAFRSIVSAYYRGANAVVLVFKIDDLLSFNQLKQFWINQVNKYKQQGCQIMLLANQCDIDEGRIEKNKINEFMQENNITIFMETSAKNGDGVNQAFRILAEKLVQKNGHRRVEQKEPRTKYALIQPEQTRIKKKSCCG